MTDVFSLKQCLPLPELMRQLGDGEHAQRKARCPFHEDKSPSFSVFPAKNGGWLWKCHAGCGQGDGVEYLKQKFGLSTGQAIRRYESEAKTKGVL